MARGGEATPELFDAVLVSAYSKMVPISSIGQVVIEDQQRATISCFDPAVASDVRDAVRDMQGMNLAPYVEEGGSGVVVVPMPRVSEETRREIVSADCVTAYTWDRSPSLQATAVALSGIEVPAAISKSQYFFR